MTRIDQLKLIAHRHAAGAVDREVATMQIQILLADDWSGVPPEQIILEAVTELLRAEARVVAADRRQRAGI